MKDVCSIVIPVHNRAALTRRCLDAILADPPRTPFEIIVVDDGSSDSTQQMLAGLQDSISVVTRPEAGGFALACNDGAKAAKGEQLAFLNNDTLPLPGWLDALAEHAERHEQAAVIGSRLLYPDGSIQHAGVVICQDGLPRHIYAGFPGNHPAVTSSRRFKCVTAACALVRRAAFEQAKGFDTIYRNCLEDADLCLRLDELGFEVHYCHESVLYHLESVSRGRRSSEIERNARIFRQRWQGRIRPDELDYYFRDGLIRIDYRDSYPLRMRLAPELAVLDGERRDEVERLLEVRSTQVLELLRETVRLTVHAAEFGLADGRGGISDPTPAGPRHAGNTDGATRERLLERAREIELEVAALQAELAAVTGGNGKVHFDPSDYLSYRRTLARTHDLVEANVPRRTTVVVISRGDDELLDLEGRTGWHFPSEKDGDYTGHHPADSEEAIAHLEEVRTRGGDYLVIPATAFWWLEHYEGFASYLEGSCDPVLREKECVIYALNGRGPISDPRSVLVEAGS